MKINENKIKAKKENNKNKYQIEITETLNKIVEIEAKDIREAILKAKELYYNEEIVLDSENYLDTEFNEYKEN